jgi:hypothetical protein
MNMREKEKMLLDVTLGVPAPEKEGKEEKKFRAELTVAIDKIRAKGQIVDVPGEMP